MQYQAIDKKWLGQHGSPKGNTTLGDIGLGLRSDQDEFKLDEYLHCEQWSGNVVPVPSLSPNANDDLVQATGGFQLEDTSVNGADIVGDDSFSRMLLSTSKELPGGMLSRNPELLQPSAIPNLSPMIFSPHSEVKQEHNSPKLLHNGRTAANLQTRRGTKVPQLGVKSMIKMKSSATDRSRNTNSPNGASHEVCTRKSPNQVVYSRQNLVQCITPRCSEPPESSAPNTGQNSLSQGMGAGTQLPKLAGNSTSACSETTRLMVLTEESKERLALNNDPKSEYLHSGAYHSQLKQQPHFQRKQQPQQQQQQQQQQRQQLPSQLVTRVQQQLPLQPYVPKPLASTQHLGPPIIFKKDDAGSETRNVNAKLRFTLSDDVLVLKLRNEHGLSWQKISEFFPGRSAKSLQVHYSVSLKNQHRDWSSKEDETLGKLYAEHERAMWDVIAKRMGAGVNAVGCMARHEYLARQRSKQLEEAIVRTQGPVSEPNARK